MYKLVAVFLFLPLIGGLYFENEYKTWYKCYVDICDWKKYCNGVSQRCEDCSARFSDCFTPAQEPNCTVFCMTYQPCQPIKTLLHGHHNGSDKQQYTHGSNVKFTCEDGYQNKGVMETVCQYFGRWSHLEPNVSHPLCKKKKCMIPRPPAHGRVEFPPDITEFEVGSQIFYRCETGHELHGQDSNRTCLTNGTWNGTLPECVASVNLWMVAAISFGALFILSLVGRRILIRLKFCGKGEKYEKITETNSQEKEFKTGEETSETRIPHEDGATIDTKSESENIHSVKKPKKAVPPTPKPSQVVNHFYKSKVSLVNGNHPKVTNKKTIVSILSSETASINSEESNESADIAVTTDAVKETGQKDLQDASARLDLPTDSSDHDKVCSIRETAVQMPDYTENDSHLIFEESTSL